MEKPTPRVGPGPASATVRPRRSPPPPDDNDDDRRRQDLVRLAKVREARASVHNPAVRRYGPALRRWYDGLPLERKKDIGRQEAAAQAALAVSEGDVPLRFRLLAKEGLDDATRARLVRKAEMLGSMEGCGEAFKLSSYLDCLCRLPLGKVCTPRLPEPGQERPFLDGLRERLDALVYGHDATKDAVLRLAARWAARPSSLGGTVLGLVGPAGVGKTTLVKALAGALGLPMAFVPLGGAQDGAYLEGHSFTYEGSMPGRIVDAVTRAGCMNPLMVFDEVDKVSRSSRGREIMGVLTHLTDPTQNGHFEDKYLSDVRLDLRHTVFVFTMNDLEEVNPILRDRMLLIHLHGYTRADKARIARDHLLPEVAGTYGMLSKGQRGDGLEVDVSDAVLEQMVACSGDAPGVRDLRRAIDAVLGGLNLRRLRASEPTDSARERMVEVTEEDVRAFCRKKDERGTLHMMYV